MVTKASDSKRIIFLGNSNRRASVSPRPAAERPAIGGRICQFFGIGRRRNTNATIPIHASIATPPPCPLVSQHPPAALLPPGPASELLLPPPGPASGITSALQPVASAGRVLSQSAHDPAGPMPREPVVGYVTSVPVESLNLKK